MNIHVVKLNFVGSNTGKYYTAKDGPACNLVEDKDECNQAATELGLKDKEASTETRDDYPPHCYFYNSNSLWFNKNKNSKERCTYRDTCICKKKTGEFGWQS